MTVTIIGVTGNLGRELLKKCLDRGIRVRGIAPHLDESAAPNGAVFYKGSAMDSELLVSVFSGCDAVFSVFPANIKDPWSYSDDTRNVIRCAKAAGVPRLIGLVGSAGAYVDQTHHLVDTDYFQETTRHFYQNVHASWDVYRSEQELDWVAFVPAARMEVQIPSRDTYRYRTDEHIVVTDESSMEYWEVSKISYTDCALAMVDELYMHRFSRQFVTVGY